MSPALSLTPVTEGNATFAEWSAEFDCAPSRRPSSPSRSATHVFRAGLEALKTALRALS